MTLLLALLAPAFAGSNPDDVAARVDAIPTHEFSAWNEAIQGILLPAFDRNGSGTIDTAAEVGAISCDAWAAVDRGVHVNFSSGVWVVYGFGPQYGWVGYALGFGEGVRSDASSALEACGLGSEDDHARYARAAAPAPTPTSSATDLVARLDGVQAADSTAWDKAVAPILRSAFDRDGSGSIDTAAELGAVSCDVWAALDRGVHRDFTNGLWVVYGFGPQYGWVGSALGFDATVRGAGAAALEACGLGSADDHGRYTAGRATSAPVAADATGLAARLDAVEAADSTAWDHAVQPLLLSTFDADRSGTIDTTGELGAIGCDVWAALDRGVHRDFSSGLWAVYGFAPTLSWVGGAIGFDEAVRAPASAALEACGLGSGDSHPRTPRAASSSSSSSDGEGLDDDAVKARLLSLYDHDGSGELDKKEALVIPCAVLAELDGAVREAWGGTGTTAIYGFEKDKIWVGYALGFAQSTRASMLKRFGACGLAD